MTKIVIHEAPENIDDGHMDLVTLPNAMYSECCPYAGCPNLDDSLGHINRDRMNAISSLSTLLVALEARYTSDAPQCQRRDGRALLCDATIAGTLSRIRRQLRLVHNEGSDTFAGTSFASLAAIIRDVKIESLCDYDVCRSGSSAFGGSSSGGLFGASLTPRSDGSGGLFGAPPGGSGSGGGLFGAAPTQRSGGLFGASPAGSGAGGGLFGASVNNNSSSQSLFGSACHGPDVMGHGVTGELLMEITRLSEALNGLDIATYKHSTKGGEK